MTTGIRFPTIPPRALGSQSTSRRTPMRCSSRMTSGTSGAASRYGACPRGARDCRRCHSASAGSSSRCAGASTACRRPACPARCVDSSSRGSACGSRSGRESRQSAPDSSPREASTREGPLRSRELRPAPRHPPPLVRVALRDQRVVAHLVPAPSVAADLARDGAAVPPETPGDGRRRPAQLAERVNVVPFFKGDLGVGHGVLSLGGELKPSLPQVTSPAFGRGDFVALTM